MFEMLPHKGIEAAELSPDRLKKFEITGDVEPSSIRLTTSNGASTVVRIKANGFCRFADDMPTEICAAIARELNHDLFLQSQLTHIVVKGLGRGPEPLVSLWRPLKE
jgi:hypothetical protein